MVYINTKYLEIKDGTCKNFEEELGLKHSTIKGIEKHAKVNILMNMTKLIMKEKFI